MSCSGIGVNYDPDKAEESAARFMKDSALERVRKSGTTERNSTLETTILGFDISRSTPLDALHFLSCLQQTITDSRRANEQ